MPLCWVWVSDKPLTRGEPHEFPVRAQGGQSCAGVAPGLWGSEQGPPDPQAGSDAPMRTQTPASSRTLRTVSREQWSREVLAAVPSGRRENAARGPRREGAGGFHSRAWKWGGELLPLVSVWFPRDWSSVVEDGCREIIHGRRGSGRQVGTGPGGGFQRWERPLPCSACSGKRSFPWELQSWPCQ